MEFQEDTNLKFVLTVAETNVVLTHLSKGTFETVSPVIAKIREQAMQQANAAPEEKAAATLTDGDTYGGND